MKTIRYQPHLKVCPYCIAPLEGVEWEDHFLIHYVEIGFENAKVVFASLVCKPLAAQLREDKGPFIHSAEIANIQLLVPIRAHYGEMAAGIPLAGRVHSEAVH